MKDPSSSSYGAGFNAVGGGVYGESFIFRPFDVTFSSGLSSLSSQAIGRDTDS